MTTPQHAANHRVDDDDESDEFGLEEMGFLFEGSRESTLKKMEWLVPSTTPKDNDTSSSTTIAQQQQAVVRVALQVVDDNPGAVISGHYLWPAAPALAQHLIHSYSQAAAEADVASDVSRPQVQSVLELGAGCALASLVALQVFSKSLKCLVVTDHDPGTLQRAQDNYELTLEELEKHSLSNETNPIALIPVLCESLSWGDVDACRTLLSRVNRDFLQQAMPDTETNTAFDLLLGTDLIYCQDVIQPLFGTAFTLLVPGGRFWLSQSFPFDDESEKEIDVVCERFGLTRTVVSDTLQKGSDNDGVRIQEFVKSSS